MTDLAHTAPRIDPHMPYLADGPLSATMGLVLIFAATPLNDLAGWSLPPGFLLGIGMCLLPWSIFNFYLGRTARPGPAPVWANIALDGAWVLASVLLLALYWHELTVWGIALLAAQALAVAAIFATKLLGARALLG